MKSNLAEKTNLRKTDTELKASVLAELEYEPSVKAADTR